MNKLTLLALAYVLSGCATSPAMWRPPELASPTPQQHRLAELPPPAVRVPVAVYGFTDQTGQFKPSDSVQTLSRAVTQGATSILVKALGDTANRQFFTVIEREKLDNVLRERAVIREMRATYLGERQLNTQVLPPLLFAGVLLEGGIIGYDSNTMTGGMGARFLGIGASTKYREDTVTIYLRAVSTKTGEVLASVSVRKSIASVGISADAFRYIAFKDLFEAEGGVTFNEPDQLALEQAIEKAVYALVAEGAMQDLWCLRTSPDAARDILTRYVAERDSIGRERVVLPRNANGQPVTGACLANAAVSFQPSATGQLPPLGVSSNAASSRATALEPDASPPSARPTGAAPQPSAAPAAGRSSTARETAPTG